MKMPLSVSRGCAAWLMVAALSLVGLPGAHSAEACQGGHLGVRWVSFQAPIADYSSVVFYHSVEPGTTSNLPVTIKGVGDDCSVPPQPVFATYQVTTPADAGRPATSGLDFTGIYPPRTSGPLYGDHQQGPTEHSDHVRLIGDSLPETVVEEARAEITGSTGRRAFPSDVPVYIVDDDGTDRVSFEHEGPFERSETYGSITVPVFRAGPAAAGATYRVEVTGSSGNPATAGDDYVEPAGTLAFAAGERVKLLTIQIHDDHRYEPPEELTLTLTDPGAVLPRDPVRAIVRILDSVGSSGLESRLHHPRQNRTYRASDYRLREIHIFTVPGEGAPVVRAELALRRDLRGGRCQWWTGKRFRRGECQNERWLPTSRYEPDFFYYRLRELRPSRGRIRSYTAFSRAVNQTGEIESFLERGRNHNIFEVRPAKR